MISSFTIRASALVSMLCLSIAPAQAQSAGDFHEVFTVATSEPVVLDVALSRGNLQVMYSRDGQVAITAYGQATNGGKLDAQYFKSLIAVEQRGNHIQLRDVPQTEVLQNQKTPHYRIDVPYRTTVTSSVGIGAQAFSGIMGPVDALGGKCDIKASYLSKGLRAQVERGNLEIEVIGERVEAKTGNGNVIGTRLAQGVTAESGDGDITLAVIGPSTATIKSGAGRIDVGGARGTLDGSTFSGDLHVKAEPHGDWHLHSASGAVRIELSPASKAELDASTDSGILQIDHDEIVQTPDDSRHVTQKLNGGGPHIEAHTGSGRILIR